MPGLLSKLASRPLVLSLKRSSNVVQMTSRGMSGSGVRDEFMHIKASRWDWMLFKNLLNLHIMLIGIPVGLLIMYSNVFVGDGVLTPLPDDRQPEHWEYERHPISRWLAKYVFMTEQEAYERTIFAKWEWRKAQVQQKLKREVLRLMYLDDDYMGYYYRPFSTRFLRAMANFREQTEHRAEGYQSTGVFQQPPKDV